MLIKKKSQKIKKIKKIKIAIKVKKVLYQIIVKKF